MTAINLALSPRAAFLVADELIINGRAAEGHVSKLRALPHLRLMVTSIGCWEFACAAAAEFNQPDWAPGISAISAKAPERVRRMFRGAHETRLILVGVCEVTGTVRAFTYESPHFAARELAPGEYTWPTVPWNGPPVYAPDGSPDPTYRDHKRYAVEQIRDQAKAYPKNIGGRIQAAEITSRGIRLSWLASLDEAAA